MKKRVLMVLMAMVVMAAGCTAKQENGNVEQSAEQDYDISKVQEYMTSVEEKSDILKTSLEQDELTQTDMNLKSQELYELWDGALNYIWGELEATLPEDVFADLQEEQLEWIEEKENAVEEVGKDFENGSLYILVVNSEAADITEERTYELYELLK